MRQSDSITLQAQPRDRVGSRHSRRLRQAGRLPAIIYGHKEAPLAVALDAKDTVKHVLSGERVFSVQMDGVGAKETVLLKDVQYDYLSKDIIHIDLERVDLNEEVEVNVHLSLVGDAPGLKEEGAVLMSQTSEVLVRCRVSDIVDHVDVDVSSLEIGGAIHAGDIPLGAGMTLASDPEQVIASIQIQQEEAEGEEVEAEAEGAEPELVSEGEEGEAGAGEEAESSEESEG